MPIDHPYHFPPEFSVAPHTAFIPLLVRWAAAKFEAFVFRCAPDIRRILQDHSLIREQLADGRAFRDAAAATS